MRTKSELTATLDALQVKKPLRLLPGSAPSFTPPPSMHNSSDPTASTQVEDYIRVANHSTDGTKTPAAKGTVIANETVVTGLPR